MQQNDTPAMRRMKFLGSYVYQLDEKGRVSLPAAFRHAAADQRFVLIQIEPPALSLFPESEWIHVEERLLDLRRRQPQMRRLVTSLLSNAVEVAPDGQGRILVPSQLREAADLEGQVQMIGAIDRIEMWNPTAFEAASAEPGAEEFEAFVPQIFG